MKKNTGETATKKRDSILFGIGAFIFILAIAGLGLWVKSQLPDVKSETIVHQEESPLYRTWEDNLSLYNDEISSMLKEFTEKSVAEGIEQTSNLEELYYKINKLIEPDFTLSELNQFLNKCVNEILSSGWGNEKKHFKLLSIRSQLDAIGSYLIRDKNFQYSSSIFDPSPFVEGSDGKQKIKEKKAGDTDPAPYSLSHLIKEKAGNCSTMPIIFAMVANRLGLKVGLVTIRDHMFARYDDEKTKINIETTSPKGMGVGTPDSFYLDLRKPTGLMLRNSTCMKTLSLRETASAFFVTQMAFLDKSGAEPYLIKRAIAYSLYFNSRSEHATMNSLNHIAGKSSEMATLKDELTKRAQYLGALPPDPKLMAKFRSKIMTFGDAVNKHQKALKTLKSQKSYNPALASLNQSPKEVMQASAINHIKDINKLNEAIRQRQQQRDKEQRNRQNSINKLESQLRADIKENAKKIDDFLKQDGDKLPNELLQMLNDTLFQNSLNFSDLNKIY